MASIAFLELCRGIPQFIQDLLFGHRYPRPLPIIQVNGQVLELRRLIDHQGLLHQPNECPGAHVPEPLPFVFACHALLVKDYFQFHG